MGLLSRCSVNTSTQFYTTHILSVSVSGSVNTPLGAHVSYFGFGLFRIQIVTRFEIGEDNTHIALLVFSEEVRFEFELDR